MLRYLAVLLTAFALAACSADNDSGQRFHAADIADVSYGGDFNLTDQNGQPRSLADFRGKIVTMFFGYTSCPDVCPTSLNRMRETFELLGEDSEKVQVLFVSVDPERDSGELLAEYMGFFGENFLGLRGSDAETARLAKAYRVYYRKNEPSESGYYTVDHSAGTFVFDTEGKLRLHAPYGQTAAEMADDLRTLLTPPPAAG